VQEDLALVSDREGCHSPINLHLGRTELPTLGPSMQGCTWHDDHVGGSPDHLRASSSLFLTTLLIRSSQVARNAILSKLWSKIFHHQKTLAENFPSPKFNETVHVCMHGATCSSGKSLAFPANQLTSPTRTFDHPNMDKHTTRPIIEFRTSPNHQSRTAMCLHYPVEAP
jgi:hypothetical protein